MPVVPRTNASKISAGAIEQALAASANSESPEQPEPHTTESSDAVASEPSGKRTTVDPSTLRETKVASDLIKLPRTMSDEWMAADADDGAYEVAQRPRWVIPAAVAGIAALGAVMVLAFGGNKDSAPPTRVVSNGERVGSASESNVAMHVDAAVAVMPVDAAEVVAVAADATAVAMVPIDAQVAVTPIDAGLVADAAVRVAEVRVDAAVPAVVATKPTTKPDATKPKEPKPPAPPADERTIEQLVDASEFAKANKACATNTMFSTPRLAACAIAACSTHSDALAARWIRAIPRASRDEIVAKCKSLGVEVATP